MYVSSEMFLLTTMTLADLETEREKSQIPVPGDERGEASDPPRSCRGARHQEEQVRGHDGADPEGTRSVRFGMRTRTGLLAPKDD